LVYAGARVHRVTDSGRRLPSLRALLLGSSLLVAAALVVPSRGRADIPPELAGQPIVQVEVAGESAALALPREIGVPRGARLNRAVVRTAIARLIATGRWTDVQVDAVAVPGGAKLIVWLVPRIVVHRLDISGNQHLDDQSVREALEVSAGAEVSTQQLADLSRAVAARYAEHGYLQAQIDVSLRDTDDPSRKVLMVRIEEGAPTRIRELHFEGDQPLDPAAVLGAMKSAEGDILDRHGLGEDVARAEAYLRERGYLGAELGAPLVTVRGEDALVAIPSHLGPRYQVAVTGYAPYSRGEIADVLGLERERLTPTLLRHTLAERLTDFYARRGYDGTSVKVQAYRGAKPGTAVLTIDIEPGKQREIAAVSFAGARHFSRDFLRDQLFSYLSEDLPGSSFAAPVDSEVVDGLLQGEPSGRQRDVPCPLLTDPERFYYEPAYKKATEHIVELYHADGFLSARVDPPELHAIGKNRAAVLISVIEGPRTLLYGVTLRGADAISPRELLTAAGLESNQPFSYVALEEARRRMLDLYRERGYAFAKVESSVRFSADRTRAEVDLQVVESFPVQIDRIVIEGAERTSVTLIRRTLKLEAGDLFRPSLARESERELGTLGVFTGVSVALQDPELPARVKSLVVTVSERRSQFLGFSAGLSTGQGIRSGFEYGYRDLFGQAVGLSLRVQFAYQVFFVDPVVAERYAKLDVQDRLERRVSLNTTIPRTPGLGRVRTSLDLVHVRDNERDFGLDQNAVRLTFAHSPLRHLTVTLGGDLENNNVDLFTAAALSEYLKGVTSPRLRRLLRVPQGASTLVDGRTSVSYDRRDSPFTPTKGYFLSTSLELARTLNGQQSEETMREFISRFLKLSLTSSGYIPLGHDIVLAGQVRAGRIFHLTSDSQTYPNRAFFLGGVETVRGFLEDEMVPQDVADQIAKDPKLDPNAIVRSGDAFVLVRGELRFPLYHELHGGLFSDLGNLWADASNLDPFKLRPTAGFGLRLATPVGPIALDWGFNLSPRRALGERSNAVHFSIGLF
jgi:outer membrane protein insertion porin family